MTRLAVPESWGRNGQLDDFDNVVLRTNYSRALQTTAGEIISSARREILSISEKSKYLRKTRDLLNCNISRNDHITYDVRSLNDCVIGYVAIWQKTNHSNDTLLQPMSARGKGHALTTCASAASRPIAGRADCNPPDGKPLSPSLRRSATRCSVSVTT